MRSMDSTTQTAPPAHIERAYRLTLNQQIRVEGSTLINEIKGKTRTYTQASKAKQVAFDLKYAELTAFRALSQDEQRAIAYPAQG